MGRSLRHSSVQQQLQQKQCGSETAQGQLDIVLFLRSPVSWSWALWDGRYAVAIFQKRLPGQGRLPSTAIGILLAFSRALLLACLRPESCLCLVPLAVRCLPYTDDLCLPWAAFLPSLPSALCTSSYPRMVFSFFKLIAWKILATLDLRFYLNSELKKNFQLPTLNTASLIFCNYFLASICNCFTKNIVFLFCQSLSV